jgi:ankyrin repeat protein
MLINSGIAVDIRNGTQRTSLALASLEGKLQVGRFLIERGADLNVRDDQGQAPLHFASQHGHLHMARLLLDHGVDPNIKRNDLWSLLHLASANEHLKIAELLVQRGASVDVANDKQENPLYQAVTNGNVAIARLLVDHGPGATVHTPDSNGWTVVLHAASRRGHLGVLKLLLWRGADVDVLNKAGRSAAELASENGQAEVANFISEYKANADEFLTELYVRRSHPPALRCSLAPPRLQQVHFQPRFRPTFRLSIPPTLFTVLRPCLTRQ